MRVLLAPDKFRGTFTAAEVCRHVARGIESVAPETTIVPLPLADGGEGTLDVLLGATGGMRRTMRVDGPLGDEISAAYGITTEGVAILESALVCGLDLVPADRRDPFRATSRGLGQAIATLLESGVSEFLIGLGGTATVDGGRGMAEALGFRFPSPDQVDDTLAHPNLPAGRFTILCDVDNPPLGPRGAAQVFGPQKGASPAQVIELEQGLEALVQGCARWKGFSGVTLSNLRMGGAAGGLGLGCSLFLGGRLVPGAVFIMERLRFPEHLDKADLLVTGEGSFDRQSRGGKTAYIAMKQALVAGVPTAVVTGRYDGTPTDGPADSVRVFVGAREENVGAEDLTAIGADVMRWVAGLPSSGLRS